MMVPHSQLEFAPSHGLSLEAATHVTPLAHRSLQRFWRWISVAASFLVAGAGIAAFYMASSLPGIGVAVDHAGILASGNRQYLLLALGGGLSTTLIASILGRSVDSDKSLQSEISTWIIQPCFLAVALVLAFQALITPHIVSHAWIALWFGTIVVTLPMLQAVTMSALKRTRRTHRVGSRAVAIVGSGEVAHRLYTRLLGAACGHEFTDVIGVFDEPWSDSRDDRNAAARVPTTGTFDDLLSLGRDEAVDSVVLALPPDGKDRIDELVQKLAPLPVDVLLGPDDAGLDPADADRDRFSLGNLPLPILYRQPHKGWGGIGKWLADKLIAGLALLLLAPVLLFVALVIRLESPGPVIFRQRRYGFNNEVFEVLKFRTMYTHLGDPSGARRTMRGDARITRVGRVLRRCSIDELPQLFNVLRGDMSIVGPRPHPVEMMVQDRLYHEAVASYPARHRMRPGLTGLAQVNGSRGEVDTLQKAQTRVAYDLKYIENWSLALDLRIMLLTFTRGLLSQEAR